MSFAYQTLLDVVGLQITVEATDGTSYQGKLESVDPTDLSIRLSSVITTSNTGCKDAALHILVPASQQKFIRLPENIKFSPRFLKPRTGALVSSSSSNKNNANSDNASTKNGSTKIKGVAGKRKSGGGGKNSKDKKFGSHMEKKKAKKL